MEPNAKLYFALAYCFDPGGSSFDPPGSMSDPPVFLSLQDEYCLLQHEYCPDPGGNPFKSCAKLCFAFTLNVVQPGLKVRARGGNVPPPALKAPACGSDVSAPGSNVVQHVFCFMSPGLKRNP